MNRSETHSRRRSQLLLVAAVASAALGYLALAAPQADAAFSTGRCVGDPVTGGGASFANTAHNSAFIPTGWPSYCSDVGSQPSVTYLSLGSGCGRYFVGARGTCTGFPSNSTGANGRNQVPRFGMSDEPLTPTTQSQINQGTDAVGDEGLIHTLPLAMGATAVVVNLPDGCDITRKPGSSTQFAVGTGDTGFTSAEQALISNFGTANTARLRLTRAQVEAAFNGGTDMDEWGELVPWINDGNGTAAEAGDTRCQDYPLFRVRRLDDSGTTYNVKDYLNKLNPSRGWLSTYSTPDSRTWPNADRTVAFDVNDDGDTTDSPAKCAAQTPQFASSKPAGMDGNGIGCTEAAIPLLQSTEILPSAGNGNDDLVNKVADWDGSIGYGDLATARAQRSFEFERQANATDGTYWVQIQDKGLTTYSDPQSAPTGFVTGGTKGSNCALANLTGIPSGSSPTTGDWSQASATDNSNTGYGICTLTYALVWDDNSGPYSAAADQAAEERKARTVKDYILSTLNDGQLYLSGFDYSPLSNSVKTIALNGTNAVNWQKTAGGGGGGGGGETGGGGTGGGGTTPAPVAPPAKPSNAFTASKPRVASKKIRVTVQVPGAGNVRATATARYKGKTIALGTASSRRSSGGAVALRLTPSAAAKKLLRKRALRATVRVTFTPTGGEENARTATLTLKKGRY
jgi:hypothetical protein